MAFSYLATNQQEPPASTVSSVGLLVTVGTPEAGALVGAGVGAGVAFGAGVGVGAGGCVGNGAVVGAVSGTPVGLGVTMTMGEVSAGLSTVTVWAGVTMVSACWARAPQPARERARAAADARRRSLVRFMGSASC